jgi:hypothetical protein
VQDITVIEKPATEGVRMLAELLKGSK